jgi:hypothetical protein
MLALVALRKLEFAALRNGVGEIAESFASRARRPQAVILVVSQVTTSGKEGSRERGDGHGL